MGRRFDVVQTEAWPDKRHYAGRAGQPVHCDPQKPKQTHQARYGQDHPLPVRVLHSNVPRGKTIKDLPQIARRSITFDRGSEFMNWPHLQAEIGTQTWFCDPSNPWQKGTVENTNRRARRWLPLEADTPLVRGLASATSTKAWIERKTAQLVGHAVQGCDRDTLPVKGAACCDCSAQRCFGPRAFAAIGANFA
jgi:hypothetical protein